ncbi:MAG: peptidoglycan-binding protein [Hyphomicrobium sp.]
MSVPVKHIAAAALALTLVLPGATSSYAQSGRDILNAFGIGAAVIIANEINKQNQGGQQSAPRQSDPAAAQRRERTMLIQSRLNALGFDAGSPDGIEGPRTRRAISDFQQYLGEAPTGDLTDTQFAVLVEQAGGIGGTGTVAAFPGEQGAFPALGAPGGSTASSPAFPSLGTAATTDAPAQAFPALGVPGSPAATAAFPKLGTAAANPRTPSFPNVGQAPVEDVAATLPLVDGAEKAALIVPAATTRTAELAKTSYGKAADPAVLGMALGSDAESVQAALAGNGFADCAGTPAALQCTRETATLRDTVKTWSVDEDGVWAIARLVQFAEPVPADFIREQFVATYPELMETENGLVASNESCAIQTQSVQALALLFDERLAGEEIDEALLRLAVDCPVAFAVAFSEGNGLVAAAQTLFFDGTSVVRQHLNAGEAKRSQISTDLKF